MPTAPTRKTPTSASAGSAPTRLASVTSVTVPGADASYIMTYAEITLANPPQSYGIAVGMFVVSDDFPAGTQVETLEETKVTLTEDPTDNSTGADVIFTRVPPAPTRKSS